MQLFLRFLIGGAFVSLFAVLGDCLNPKSFAGLFGAAPSIALAGFILEWAHRGPQIVATEARTMILGAVALVIYSASSAVLVRRTHLSPWLLTGALWLEWGGVAALLHAAVLR